MLAASLSLGALSRAALRLGRSGPLRMEVKHGHALFLRRHGERTGYADKAESALRGGRLLFVLFYLHGFKVFGFEDLEAVQAFDVVDAVAPGDDLGAGMVASGWHKQRFR
jgi:hypothetical protein